MHKTGLISMIIMPRVLPLLAVLYGVFVTTDCYAGRADTISQIRLSIVGIGTAQKTRVPKVHVRGTGFVILDGLHVITNAHVIAGNLNTKKGEFLAVLTGVGSAVSVRPATVIGFEKETDLVVLKIKGPPINSLDIGAAKEVREGDEYLFTGFPLGHVLGLYPVTHRGMISAITPIVIPAKRSSLLTSSRIKRLRSPYKVFQLDAVAYPGNSGSPLYSSVDGSVVGVVNMVLVKKTKEGLLSSPSGIAYAIPVKHVRALLIKLGLL